MRRPSFPVCWDKQPQPQFLQLVFFLIVRSPEKPRDIAFILSVLKRVQRWRASWLRSIYRRQHCVIVLKNERSKPLLYHVLSKFCNLKFSSKIKSFKWAKYVIPEINALYFIIKALFHNTLQSTHCSASSWIFASLLQCSEDIFLQQTVILSSTSNFFAPIAALCSNVRPQIKNITTVYVFRLRHPL